MLAQRTTDEVGVATVSGEITTGSPHYYDYSLSEVPAGNYYILAIAGVEGEPFDDIGPGDYIGYYGMPSGGELADRSVVTVESSDLSDYDVVIWMDGATL